MVIQRIVSFLPSATELIYELEAGDRLYGVTHECDYPDDAKSKPRVINSVFDHQNMSSKQIDDKIMELTNAGQEIYSLDEKNLIASRPDLIISQDICEVCSAHTNQVKKAVSILENKPQVHTLHSHSLSGILSSIRDVAKIIGKEVKGEQLIASLKKKTDFISEKKIDYTSKVLCLEWLEPFFSSGHWVPEMVRTAGGQNQITKDGDRSRRLSFWELESCDADVIVLMPCGFDVGRTISEYKKILRDDESWNSLRAVQDKKVFAVDANSYFSKPSLRTFTGVEILAKILHPQDFGDLAVPDNSFEKIES